MCGTCNRYQRDGKTKHPKFLSGKINRSGHERRILAKWTELVHDRVQWRVFFNMVMQLLVP